MLQDEKKHFPTPALNGNNLTTVTNTALATSKVSPLWTMDDIDSLRKGIVSSSLHGFLFKCYNSLLYLFD